MKPIGPPDSHYLSAASGWLGLGSWQEAAAEIAQISPALQTHPAVLQVRYEVYVKAGQWDSAAEVAIALLEKFPGDPGAWVSVAYATRRKAGGGIPKAREILERAHTRFPKEPIIAYNLACYDCQLNRPDDAMQWLAKAIRVGSPAILKKMALADSDLKPIWPQIGKLSD